MPDLSVFHQTLYNVSYHKHTGADGRTFQIPTSGQRQSRHQCEVAALPHSPHSLSKYLYYLASVHIMGPEVTAALDLNCLVLGEDRNSIFNIKIPDGAKVSDLKEAIMDKKKNTFQRIDADALHIFKVSLPDEDDLLTKLQYFRPQHDPDNGVQHLVPTKRLKAFFEDVEDGHVHVIVNGPSTSIGELFLIFRFTFFTSAAGQKRDADDDSSIEIREDRAYYFRQNCVY
jgi:hypothetical protein